MSHLVHVGFHKTGSTWLQRHVFPSVSGARSAIGDRVVNVLLRQMVFDETFYEEALVATLRALGPRVLMSYEALVGMPWGPSNPERTADRLSRVAPRARILIVTREQQSFTRSLYAQYVNEGGPLPLRRFPEVLNESYLDIDATVSRFTSRFDRVRVIDYDDLRTDPRGAVEEIGAFGDVRFIVPTGDERENVSLSGWRLDALRVWNRYCRRSVLNPDPILPVPNAAVMRRVLQRSGAQERRGQILDR